MSIRSYSSFCPFSGVLRNWFTLHHPVRGPTPDPDLQQHHRVDDIHQQRRRNQPQQPPAEALEPSPLLPCAVSHRASRSHLRQSHPLQRLQLSHYARSHPPSRITIAVEPKPDLAHQPTPRIAAKPHLRAQPRLSHLATLESLNPPPQIMACRMPPLTEAAPARRFTRKPAHANGGHPLQSNPVLYPVAAGLKKARFDAAKHALQQDAHAPTTEPAASLCAYLGASRD